MVFCHFPTFNASTLRHFFAVLSLPISSVEGPQLHPWQLAIQTGDWDLIQMEMPEGIVHADCQQVAVASRPNRGIALDRDQMEAAIQRGWQKKF